VARGAETQQFPLPSVAPSESLNEKLRLGVLHSNAEAASACAHSFIE
jgi:hypothetical protein